MENYCVREQQLILFCFVLFVSGPASAAGSAVVCDAAYRHSDSSCSILHWYSCHWAVKSQIFTFTSMYPLYSTFTCGRVKIVKLMYRLCIYLNRIGLPVYQLRLCEYKKVVPCWNKNFLATEIISATSWNYLRAIERVRNYANAKVIAANHRVLLADVIADVAISVFMSFYVCFCRVIKMLIKNVW